MGNFITNVNCEELKYIVVVVVVVIATGQLGSVFTFSLFKGWQIRIHVCVKHE